MQQLQDIDEVNMFKDDHTVIQRAGNEAGKVMRYLIDKGEGQNK